MHRQIELAHENGLSGFIFDTYIGQKANKPIHEMKAVLDTAFLGQEASRKLSFATMAILGSPRVVLPVPAEKGYEEMDRYYDFSKGTVEEIIDHNVRTYWSQENYFRIKGRPYLSIFSHDRRQGREGERSVPEMVEYMKEYSLRRYSIEPYIAGVCLRADAAVPLLAHGADAMTGYAFLCDFENMESEPVQDYSDLLDQRVDDWETIQKDIGDKPYVPPVVVGWDASPRGAHNVRLDDVRGMYPFCPIVENGSPELFEKMLNLQADFVQKHVPEDERYQIITAWNEITEGAALLPRIAANGEVDDSYLAVLRKYRTRMLKKEEPCLV